MRRELVTYNVFLIGVHHSPLISSRGRSFFDEHAALLTMGEGYHNFHHQFPMDYRNAVRWYQFDPTKWFIATCGVLGLASNLRVFPENEINKGELAMQLKKLKKVQDNIRWPIQVDDLPIVSWEKCELPRISSTCYEGGRTDALCLRGVRREVKKESEERVLVIVSGFIHDVSEFLDEHPGGRGLLLGQRGKDATAAFFGGVYEHGNAAHNVRPARQSVNNTDGKLTGPSGSSSR